jgi:hypothetical protein
MFINWRDYEPGPIVPVKSPEKAFEEFRQKKLHSPNGEPDRVEFTKFSLVYYEQAAGSEEEYLQPAYLIEGTVWSGGTAVDFGPVYILATDEMFDYLD